LLHKWKFILSSTNNIEIIKWAFEKGYRLASADMKEGIHIDFSEIENFFLRELAELDVRKNNIVPIPIEV
jgi:hypothetical protein